MFSGHGDSSTVAGMPVQTYQELLAKANDFKPELIGLSSCQSAGKISLNHEGKLKNQIIRLDCPIITMSLGDISMCANENWPFLFSGLETKLSNKKALFLSDFKKAMRNGFGGKNEKLLRNRKQVIMPRSTKFPLAIKLVNEANDTHIISPFILTQLEIDACKSYTEKKDKEKLAIEISPKENLIALYSSYVRYPIIIKDTKPPKISSQIGGAAEHLLEQIQMPDVLFNDFVQSLDLPFQRNIRANKAFFIKSVILKDTKLHKVCIKQRENKTSLYYIEEKPGFEPVYKLVLIENQIYSHNQLTATHFQRDLKSILISCKPDIASFRAATGGRENFDKVQRRIRKHFLEKKVN